MALTDAPQRSTETPSAPLGSRRLTPGRLQDLGWHAALVLEIIAIILVWQVAIGTFELWNPRFFPPPSDIWAATVAMAESGVLWTNFLASNNNFWVGYLIAATTGVTFGLSLGLSSNLRLALGPLFWAMYATPRIALQPLLVLWLGFGPGPKILIIFLMAFFPVAANAMDGVQTVDRSLVRAAQVFGARRIDLYTKVVLPATLPFVLAGLRMGIARGMVGIVIGEFIGGREGLGFLILRRSADFDMAASLALTIMLVLMAVVGMSLLQFVKRRVAPWHKDEESF